MAAASRKSYITRKHLQRLVGLLTTWPKWLERPDCSSPAYWPHYARLRLSGVSQWPRHYPQIRVQRVVRRIWADACLKGAGVGDESRYYDHVFDPSFASDHHISQLEALNCVAAVRKFVGKKCAGDTIEVMYSVDVFTSGRARDPILAGCSRTLWFHAATTDTDIVFTHVPGEGMVLPDAFSRASLDDTNKRHARALVRELRLQRVSLARTAFSYCSFM